jgi:hypothetical protein
MMKHIVARRLARAIVLLMTITAFLLAPPVIRAQEGDAATVPVAAYQEAVREAASTLQADPAKLEEVRRHIATLEQVELNSGERMTVAPLLGDDAELEAPVAQDRLDTVAAQLDAAAQDQSAARLAVLEQVLAGPAFQQQESLLDQLRGWLADLFDRWAVDPIGNPEAGPVETTIAQIAGWSVVAVAAALLIFLLARWLQTMLQSFIGEAAATRAQEGALPATPAAARMAAGRFAQGGDYRAAVRHLYLAALLTLQEQRIVARDPSLTNREVLAHTPATHPVHTSLQSVVEVFDDVWYGVHEPDQATFEHYQAAVDDLERRAATPAASKERP